MTTYDIFKSYAHKDEAKVNLFSNILVHTYGLKVWQDKNDIYIGQDWRKQIIEGIKSSKLMLCFISEKYLNSSNCRSELKIASEYRINFHLIMMENVPIDSDDDLKMYIVGKHRSLIYLNDNQPNIWCGELFLKLLQSISLAINVPFPIITEITKNELNITDWNNLEELGSGATATVYEATYENYKVAVKKFHSNYPKSKLFRKDFLNEMDLLGRINHQNLVKLFGYNNREETYLVFELMDCSLYDCLHLSSQPDLDSDIKLRIIRSIINGINYLHDSHGIVHGDLKSQNILLSEDRKIAKITDFGLAKVTTTLTCFNINKVSNENSSVKKISGSIRWMSPEKLKGDITRKSDIWSFGMILIEIATRKLPFGNIHDDLIIIKLLEDNEAIILQYNKLDNVPEFMKNAIEKCLKRDTNDRADTQWLANFFSLYSKEIKNEKQSESECNVSSQEDLGDKLDSKNLCSPQNKLRLAVARRKRTLANDSKEWNDLREIVIKRDGSKCRFCQIKLSDVLHCDFINRNMADNRLENLGLNCPLCNLISHCGKAGLDNRLLLYQSKMDQTEIVRQSLNFFLQFNRVPQPNEIDPKGKLLEATTINFANKLVQYDYIELSEVERNEYKGFFNPKTTKGHFQKIQKGLIES